MWNRGGIRSAALEKAKLQLSGQRVLNSGASKGHAGGEGVHFGKVPLQARQVSFPDLGDLSSEDAESQGQDNHTHPSKMGPRPGSRFLKKSANNVNRETSASVRASADRSDSELIPHRSSQSAALSRLSMIEDRIRNRKTKTFDPDKDTDPSVPQGSGLSVRFSRDQSMTGSHFLKKKESSSTCQKEPEESHVDGYVAPADVVPNVKKGVSLESDEEDMRRLLGELLSSPDISLSKGRRPVETSPQLGLKTYKKVSKIGSSLAAASKDKSPVSSLVERHQKSPSPSLPSPKIHSSSRSDSHRAGLSQRSSSSASSCSEVRSLDELFRVASEDDTQDDRSAASDDFKLNIMTLDNFAPVPFGEAELSKEKSEGNSSAFRKLGPSPAEEIPPEIRPSPEDTPVEYESDFEKEGQSAISEHLSDEEKHSSITTEPQSVQDKSQSHDDQSLSEEPSKSTSQHYSRSESCLSRSRTSFSSSDTITQSERHSPTPRRSMKDVCVQAQADGLVYPWLLGQNVPGPSIGVSFVDPAPVAVHTISPEAVDALSASNPAMVALNDMLRQQLALTRNFIESSRHLHHTMMESLGPPNYKYTTLEETKKLLQRNTSPRLTVEDALEEVLQEMRDYHYI